MIIYEKVEPIRKGNSSVDKYLLVGDKKYICRLYDPKYFEGRRKSFDLIKYAQDYGILFPKLIDVGTYNDKFYSIFEYIEGETLDKIEYLKYIKQVVKVIKSLHSIPIKKIDIKKEYTESINRKMNRLRKLNITFNEELIKQYIDSNICYLDSKASIIHGDFHLGNILLGSDNLIYLIDNDVLKIGSRYKDIVSLYDSKDFSNQFINEYFNLIPENFWINYYLYYIDYILSYIYYCHRKEDMNLLDGIEKLEEFFIDTNYLENQKPKWYIGR